MRVVWSPTLGYAEPDAEVLELSAAAVADLERLGCDVVTVEDVVDADPIDMWISEFYAGVGTRLKTALKESRDLIDPVVVGVLDKALDQTTEEYYTNVFRRYEFRERMRALFEGCDLLVTPTVPVPAFDVGLPVPPGLAHRDIVSWVYYTYPFNLTGQPAASVPAGYTKAGPPVGLQLVAKINHETDIFRAAAALERQRPWADRTPAVSA
jgi:aspartyl-tRNA(Asn)/glutamyl-tRNA(Gln) amidotransferase subunit A